MIRSWLCRRFGHRPRRVIVGWTAGAYEERRPRFGKMRFCQRCRTEVP